MHLVRPLGLPPELSREAKSATAQDLVERIRGGETAAFETLFADFASPLCNYANRLVSSPEVARELVQDLFLQLWRQRAQWKVTNTLATYLYTATRNRAASYMRRARLERAFLERATREERSAWGPSIAPAPDATHDADELSRALRIAVQSLPPRPREVFMLAREHDLSYAEIAAILQISPKTVEVHMGRALAALKERLAAWRR